MAAAKIGYRGNAIGISAGLGIALPLAAYAATISLDGVNDIVRADAMPFAAGALVGVGMLAATGHLLDVHAERLAEERAEAERYASLYGGATGVQASSDARTATARRDPSQTLIGKRFNRSSQPSGVPVIARAVDALDEMEAWAEIDAMFSDDSPFSCDPARSKDMYQIALEELRRAEAARSVGASTVTRVAAPTADEREAENDRNDALTALYGSSVAARSYAPSMPTMSASAASQPATAANSTASAPATDDDLVPMADYSGHEDMWARALAILGSDDSSSTSAGAPAQGAFSVGFAGGAKTGAGLAGDARADRSLTDVERGARGLAAGDADARRAAAVAEGSHATRMHSHVNALIEEEFDKVPSKSVHSTTHEYLKVIEGGTASMPSLQTAEA